MSCRAIPFEFLARAVGGVKGEGKRDFEPVVHFIELRL